MTLNEVVGNGAAAWALASACINAAFWFQSPDEWVAFCERSPRSAAVLKVVRALGIEPRRLLIAVQEFAAAHRGPRKPPPLPKPPSIPPAGLS